VSDDEEAKPPSSSLKIVDGGQASASTEALFDDAVRAHSRRLLAVARGIVGNRASPEDVVQQALLNLYQHRARYDWHEAGGLMRRAVVNEALRLLRSPRMAAVTDDLPSDGNDAPSHGLVERETVERVRDAIDRLPEHFRSALILCEYEKMSYQDIANTLDVSVPQVKTWIHRGRRRLAEMLKGYMDAQPKASRPRAEKTEARET
jgi:RNA polymerase sigma factor (sigma-70 family)